METECFRQVGVDGKLPLQSAEGGGHMVLGVKVDGTHRSRLVAKDVKTCNVPEVFVTTRPIELLEYILRPAAREREQQRMRISMTRAYFTPPR